MKLVVSYCLLEAAIDLMLVIVYQCVDHFYNCVAEAHRGIPRAVRPPSLH